LAVREQIIETLTSGASWLRFDEHLSNIVKSVDEWRRRPCPPVQGWTRASRPRDL